jgi:hypothetical protein
MTPLPRNGQIYTWRTRRVGADRLETLEREILISFSTLDAAKVDRSSTERTGGRFDRRSPDVASVARATRSNARGRPSVLVPW